MKTAKTLMSVLLLSAVSMAPAYANWFSNSRTNTMMNIGSAPNPTPADLRRIGDSTASNGVAFASVPQERPVVERVAYVTPKTNLDVPAKAGLRRLEGKTVYGAHGARLGSILTVNLNDRLADVQLPGGIAVAMPASLLMDKGTRVTAPTISPLDMMAMAKTQTGRTVAIDVDRRHMPIRSRG